MELKLLVLGLFLGGMLIIGIVAKLMAGIATAKQREDLIASGMWIFGLWVIFGGLATFLYLTDVK